MLWYTYVIRLTCPVSTNSKLSIRFVTVSFCSRSMRIWLICVSFIHVPSTFARVLYNFRLVLFEIDSFLFKIVTVHMTPHPPK